MGAYDRWQVRLCDIGGCELHFVWCAWCVPGARARGAKRVYILSLRTHVEIATAAEECVSPPLHDIQNKSTEQTCPIALSGFVLSPRGARSGTRGDAGEHKFKYFSGRCVGESQAAEASPQCVHQVACIS